MMENSNNVGDIIIDETNPSTVEVVKELLKGLPCEMFVYETKDLSSLARRGKLLARLSTKKSYPPSIKIKPASKYYTVNVLLTDPEGWMSHTAEPKPRKGMVPTYVSKDSLCFTYENNCFVLFFKYDAKRYDD